MEILCRLWNSKHHLLHQWLLCSAVNPHWYQMKFWQISHSGHHNSSLAILSCLCYWSYPIPVWSTLILMHKPVHSVPHPHVPGWCQLHTHTHKVNTTSRSSLLSHALYLSSPASCCGQQFIPSVSCQLTHTYTHRMNKLYHTINCDVSMGSRLYLSTLVIYCKGVCFNSFWQRLRQ